MQLTAGTSSLIESASTRNRPAARTAARPTPRRLRLRLPVRRQDRSISTPPNVLPTMTPNNGMLARSPDCCTLTSCRSCKYVGRVEYVGSCPEELLATDQVQRRPTKHHFPEVKGRFVHRRRPLEVTGFDDFDFALVDPGMLAQDCRRTTRRNPSANRMPGAASTTKSSRPIQEVQDAPLPPRWPLPPRPT